MKLIQRSWAMGASILLALVFSVGLFGLNPVSASAAAHGALGKNLAQSTQQKTQGVVPAVSCTDDGCDGLSPVSTGCSSGAVTERTATSGDLGGGLQATINLRFNLSCHAAWTQVVFNQPLPSNRFGDAEIDRNTDGKVFFCESSGGNGQVQPGQTSCFTPMVGDGPSESTFAQGWYFVSSWNVVATTSSF